MIHIPNIMSRALLVSSRMPSTARHMSDSCYCTLDVSASLSYIQPLLSIGSSCDHRSSSTCRLSVPRKFHPLNTIPPPRPSQLTGSSLRTRLVRMTVSSSEDDPSSHRPPPLPFLCCLRLFRAALLLRFSALRSALSALRASCSEMRGERARG